MKHRITEARLNDACYLLLKKAYFEPVGLMNPRECDIRVCMDMSAPERLTPMSAILLPNEKAGMSHNIWYEVDPNFIREQTIEYLIDHWRAKYSKSDLKFIKKAWAEMWGKLIEIPEEQVAVEITKEEFEREEQP